VKRPILAVAIGVVMFAGGWWGYHRVFDTYSTQEVTQASDLVERYYAHLLAKEFAQALGVLAIPDHQVRDWAYERQWRSGYLQKLDETGEYQILRYEGPELIGGPPHNRPRRDRLTFYATMDVEMNGQRATVAENVQVGQVDGRFQIVGFESTDHYVRFRAHEFELPSVAERWAGGQTKPYVVQLDPANYRQVHFLRDADSVWQIDAEETLVWTGFREETNQAYIATTMNDQTHACPRQFGRLTITGVEGNRIRFRSDDGSIGWFDLKTSVWSFDSE
jgi:hypothetical protein